MQGLIQGSGSISTCTVRIHFLRCSPDKTLQVNDEVTNIGLGFSALGRMHNTRSTLRWLMTNIGFGVRCNRLGAIRLAQESLGKEVES